MNLIGCKRGKFFFKMSVDLKKFNEYLADKSYVQG